MSDSWLEKLHVRYKKVNDEYLLNNHIFCIQELSKIINDFTVLNNQTTVFDALLLPPEHFFFEWLQQLIYSFEKMGYYSSIDKLLLDQFKSMSNVPLPIYFLWVSVYVRAGNYQYITDVSLEIIRISKYKLTTTEYEFYTEIILFKGLTQDGKLPDFSNISSDDEMLSLVNNIRLKIEEIQHTIEGLVNNRHITVAKRKLYINELSRYKDALMSSIPLKYNSPQVSDNHTTTFTDSTPQISLPPPLSPWSRISYPLLKLLGIFRKVIKSLYRIAANNSQAFFILLAIYISRNRIFYILHSFANMFPIGIFQDYSGGLISLFNATKNLLNIAMSFGGQMG